MLGLDGWVEPVLVQVSHRGHDFFSSAPVLFVSSVSQGPEDARCSAPAPLSPVFLPLFTPCTCLPLFPTLPRIVKLVRAIRNGWIKTRKQKAAEAKKEAEVYLMWGDDDQVGGAL